MCRLINTAAAMILNSSDKTTTQIYSNDYSPQQVIKNFVKAMSETDFIIYLNLMRQLDFLRFSILYRKLLIRWLPFPQVNEAHYSISTTFTIRGLIITVPEKDTLSGKEQLVVQVFYSWWAEEAIKLMEEIYGLTFNGQSMMLSCLNLAHTSFNADDKIGNGLGDYLFPHEMTHVLQDDFNIWSYMTN